MPFELFDFGQGNLVEQPHSYSSSCWNPCAMHEMVKNTEHEIKKMIKALGQNVRQYRKLRTEMNFTIL